MRQVPEEGTMKTPEQTNYLYQSTFWLSTNRTEERYTRLPLFLQQMKTPDPTEFKINPANSQ